MSTFIKRHDQVEGPFTDAEIRQKLNQGLLTPQTPAWRVGMPQWKTIADLLPPAPPATPPPLPKTGETPVSDAEFRESLRFVNSVFTKLQPPPVQPDATERLIHLGNRFFGLLDKRLGQTARTNHTFYAYRVVTAAIQRIRLDLLKGAALTAKGEEFVALAAAYLAMLAVLNWQRRGMKVSGSVHFAPGAPDNGLFFFAERSRNGTLEVYSHDFLADMHQPLLRPPQMFPSLHGRAYVLNSLTLPSPEYLYQYGVHLLQSPQAGGNWPTTQKVGGLDEDFSASRGLLVNDLHQDCGLPKDDAAMRKLSWWIVFPPYGWDMNDGQDYNLMTVFDQISFQKVLPFEVAVDYLRALLNSQSIEIRNLAARCLMVYHVAPRHAADAGHYQQAMASHDWDMARGSMAKYQSQIEKVQPTEAWHTQLDQERRRWLEQTPPTLSLRTVAEKDPDYIALGQLPPERAAESLSLLEKLAHRYPTDWVLKVLHASLLMAAADPAGGEARLRQLIKDPPDCCEGHSRLGTQLKRQGRLAESMEVYEDEVRRWPWNHRAVDSCLWLVTEGMTRF